MDSWIILESLDHEVLWSFRVIHGLKDNYRQINREIRYQGWVAWFMVLRIIIER